MWCQVSLREQQGPVLVTAMVREYRHMRLYLSSYRLGDRPEVFAEMVTGRRRGWIITNPLDGLDEDRRRSDVATQVEDLRSIGLEAADFDLIDGSTTQIV